MGRLRDFTNKVLQITHGRTTAFFVAFFIAGHAMALAGKLTTVYVAYLATLGGLVLGHSVKEDILTARFGPQGGSPDADPKS
jgi:hypothetical protein